jgi:fructose-1,6-bisphosphatase/inositol monophosphatase family enzyme
MDVARQCAAEAWRIIDAAAGDVAIRRTKGRGNVVTETDIAVERAVTGTLTREYRSTPSSRRRPRPTYAPMAGCG